VTNQCEMNSRIVLMKLIEFVIKSLCMHVVSPYLSGRTHKLCFTIHLKLGVVFAINVNLPARSYTDFQSLPLFRLQISLFSVKVSHLFLYIKLLIDQFKKKFKMNVFYSNRPITYLKFKI